MSHITHYCYEADTHCVDCTKARFGVNPNATDYVPGDSDQNYVRYDASDSEGNSIYPVFAYDEGGGDVTCGTCLTAIRKHFAKGE